jgi:TonB-dependent starch-binding outer membrane protein SusC
MASLRSQRNRLAIWLLGIVAVAACATATGRSGAIKSAPGEVVISADQIRESGATTAWEVIRRTAPHFNLTDGPSGEPSRMKRRGRSTLYLDDTPAVFLDGVRVSDFRTLAQIPAHTISSITILSGIEGSTRYGTNAGNGVILIHTKTD